MNSYVITCTVERNGISTTSDDDCIYEAESREDAENDCLSEYLCGLGIPMDECHVEQAGNTLTIYDDDGEVDHCFTVKAEELQYHYTWLKGLRYDEQRAVMVEVESKMGNPCFWDTDADHTFVFEEVRLRNGYTIRLEAPVEEYDEEEGEVVSVGHDMEVKRVR